MVVKIVQFPETQVAMLRHRGSPDWSMLRRRSLSPGARRAGYRRSPPARPGACSTIPRPPPLTISFDIRVGQRTDRGKRLWRGEWHHSGRAMRRAITARWIRSRKVSGLYRDWLPTSGETPRDFPAVFSLPQLA